MSAGNFQRRKSRVAASLQCVANASILKVATKAREGPPPDAAVDNDGRGEKYYQSKASVEMALYDHAGSNHRQSEGESTAHLNAAGRRKKAQPGELRNRYHRRGARLVKNEVSPLIFWQPNSTISERKLQLARLCSWLDPRLETDPAPGQSGERACRMGCFRCPQVV